MIYGVFAGEYSDWQVIGYFKTAEEAEAYCDRKNKSSYYSFDECYVIPMYDLSVTPYEGKLMAYDVDLDKGIATPDCMCDDNDASEDGILVKDNIFGKEMVIVWVYPAEADKIIKIARDRYAAYIARKEGIA